MSLPPVRDGIAGTGIALGTTLYSMTSEFAAGLYTPETLIKAVHDFGIGPGVEFNIAQLLRTYPDVDQEFVKLWFDSLEKYGLDHLVAKLGSKENREGFFANLPPSPCWPIEL